MPAPAEGNAWHWAWDMQPSSAQRIFDDGDMSTTAHIHIVATRLQRRIVIMASMKRARSLGLYVELMLYSPGYGPTTLLTASEATSLSTDPSVIWLHMSQGGGHFSAFTSKGTPALDEIPRGALGLAEIP